MNHQCYDAIVVGTGGFGSSTLYHLAQRGMRVLGLDRFPPAHDRGSSHGQTRIIRQAYFEHADYVPLLKRTYALWHDLAAESGRDLMTLCGLLIAGPSEGIAVPGARFASQKHGLDLEDVSRSELQTRFPGFRIPATSTPCSKRSADLCGSKNACGHTSISRKQREPNCSPV